MTGIFATKEVNDLFKGKPMGWVDGNAGQMLNQAMGCLIAIALGMAGTYVILKVCDALIGVRAEKQDEIAGLDLSMHGEDGYNFDS